MIRTRTILVATALVASATVLALGVVGYPVYTKAKSDPVTPVDAIIVLGGEHDGREEYALELARQGISRVVVLSDPYESEDGTLAQFCTEDDEPIRVFCVPPVPSTTRGEAIFTRELAAEHGWTSVMVVTWQFHLARARFIFSQCFDGEIVMRAVPREYDFGLVGWAHTYLYQSAAFVKAAVQGRCRS